MQLIHSKHKTKNTFTNQFYHLQQNKNNLQNPDSLNKVIKINLKKLPPDFFTARKNKIHFSANSHKNSTRTSKQRHASHYSSTIPINPSFIANSISNSLPKTRPIFAQANSIQLKQYHDSQSNSIPLRKMNSQVIAHQPSSKQKEKRKRQNSMIQSVENRSLTLNQFQKANDLFNCTFAKKICEPSIQSEKFITQKSPGTKKHYEKQKKRSAKTGQQRRLSKHIFDMIQIQKRMAKKVNQFENIGADLKIALNKKIYGDKKNSQLQVLSSRQEVQLRSINLPPIESARAKA